RELDTSGAAPNFQIDVNRCQGPQGPALLRPRREVVADSDCPALAGRCARARYVGPTARMTGFPSICAAGSAGRAGGQVVCRAVNDGCDTAPRREAIERIFVDVPFDTWAVHPPVHPNGRKAAGRSRL